MENLTQNRLEVVLAEYSNIRSELRDVFRLHLQLFAITVSAVAVILGYAFVQRTYVVFLVVPAFTIALFYRWLWDQHGAMALSFYQFIEIEKKKIPLLVGLIDQTQKGQNLNKQEYEQHWMAWQLFYLDLMDRLRTEGFPRAHVFPVVGIFLLLPLVLSIGYTVFWLSQNLNCNNLDYTVAVLHIAPNLAYGGVSVYGILSYMKLNRYFLRLYQSAGHKPVV